MDAQGFIDCITQMETFSKWIEDMSKEEGVKTDFLKGMGMNLKAAKAIAYAQKITGLPVVDALRKRFFSASQTSRFAMRFHDMDLEEFQQMIRDTHIMTGRLLDERMTTTFDGSKQITEMEKMLNNIRWFADIAEEMCVAGATAMIPANAPREQTIAEIREAVNDTELALLQTTIAVCEQLVQQHQNQEEEQKQADHLTARQCRRRGLPPPRTGSKKYQAPETVHQETICENSNTPLEDSFDSLSCDAQHDAEEAPEATSTK